MARLETRQALHWCFDLCRPKPRGPLSWQAGDVFWCTADCGWVTGHTYVAYGPLLAGATSVVFGSTPMFPTVDRVWQVIARYKVHSRARTPPIPTDQQCS